MSERMIDATDAPHGGRRAVTLEDVADQLAEVLRRLDHIDVRINALHSKQNVVNEFVDVIKGIGAQAAKGGGMQAMMLRNMVPGIENLAAPSAATERG